MLESSHYFSYKLIYANVYVIHGILIGSSTTEWVKNCFSHRLNRVARVAAMWNLHAELGQPMTHDIITNQQFQDLVQCLEKPQGTFRYSHASIYMHAYSHTCMHTQTKFFCPYSHKLQNMSGTRVRRSFYQAGPVEIQIASGGNKSTAWTPHKASPHYNTCWKCSVLNCTLSWSLCKSLQTCTEVLLGILIELPIGYILQFFNCGVWYVHFLL